ncbi:AAA family ATPase [Streptomyces griseorubiginosus]|uniref:AAA family ATPase n=1 Tax=Streptomyces griseorubiginosus TaxID=67304 RepID=UPI0033BEA96B
MSAVDPSKFCGHSGCEYMEAAHDGHALGHPFTPSGGPWLSVVTPEEEAGEVARDRFPSLDWDELFEEDHTQIDWLPGRFMERGQQVALVGDGKVGKTLFVHDWLLRCTTGKPFLGYGTGAPLKVLYFDRENGRRDIKTRMLSLGAKPGDLRDYFDYRMFPAFDPLDTNQFAVLAFFQIVDEVKPDIVVIDTVSRFITGNENESNTWLAFYRNIHAPLKARGIACVRLDHMGKDSEKGSRGSSAKSQDVDHVWEMLRTEPRFEQQGPFEVVTTDIKMKRTHTRTGLGEDVIHIRRVGHKSATGMWIDEGTYHELHDASAAQRLQQQLKAEENEIVQKHVTQLVKKGVPEDLGRDALKRWCKANRYPLPGKTETVGDIVKGIKAYYANRPPLFEGD